MLRLITITLLLIFTSTSFSACEKQEKEERAGNTALRDYVKVPLDAAKIADKKANRHNRNLQKSLDEY